jgi:hypothetical protein
VIWLLVVPVVLAILLGVLLCLSAQAGHRAYQERRAVKVGIEREKRRAERHLYDVSSRAFSAMTEAVRGHQSSGCPGHR